MRSNNYKNKCGCRESVPGKGTTVLKKQKNKKLGLEKKEHCPTKEQKAVP